MKKLDIARALRDSEYRNSLSAEKQALLPAHPAGVSTIDDSTLKGVTGGCGQTACGCGPFTSPSFSCFQPNETCHFA